MSKTITFLLTIHLLVGCGSTKYITTTKITLPPEDFLRPCVYERFEGLVSKVTLTI